MKKKPKCSSPSRINDQVCPSPFTVKASALATPEPAGPNAFVRFSYLPAQPPRVEPAKLPRLFIRGGRGGSVKMDLSGVGIWLQQSAFAFTMPDDSLSGLDIHAGDIAVVEPGVGALKVGGLVLVYDGEKENLRQISSLQGGVRVQTANRKRVRQRSFVTCSLLGEVLGVLRLYRRLKPVPYQPEDFQYDPLPEISSATLKFRQRHPDKARLKAPRVYYPANSTGQTRAAKL